MAFFHDQPPLWGNVFPCCRIQCVRCVSWPTSLSPLFKFRTFPNGGCYAVFDVKLIKCICYRTILRFPGVKFLTRITQTVFFMFAAQVASYPHLRVVIVFSKRFYLCLSYNLMFTASIFPRRSACTCNFTRYMLSPIYASPAPANPQSTSATSKPVGSGGPKMNLFWKPST